jgi:hypothetical protein
MNKKVALTLGASVLSVGLLGSAAFAAFAPVSGETFAQTQSPVDQTVDTEEGPKGDKLKALLDGLVSKGVITQAQEDKILEAAKDAAGKHGDKKDRKGDAARHVFASLMADSEKYLGLSGADLKTKLQGTSLGALADSMPPKSRSGLIATLTDSVNAAIAKAFSENKLTKEQADKARTEAPEHIAKFVDHKFEQHKAKAPNARMFIGDAFAVARDYTGLSQKDIMAGLRDGKSLAELATGAGKTRDGLIKAIVDAANAKIDKAAAGGKATADQATELKAEVAKAVPALVDRKGKLTAAQ